MTNTSNLDAINERRLCATCIGEEFLRGEVGQLGTAGRCDYCGNAASSCSIREIAKYIDTAFEQHYRLTPVSPSSMEYSLRGDSGWLRDGEYSADAIANAAEITEDPAEDIRRVLEDWHNDQEMAEMGVENPFARDACYEEIEPDDFEYWTIWHDFENILKTEARFFSASMAETLSDIFEGLSEVSGSDGTPIIIEVGPGTAMTSVYRSRVFQAEVDLEAALERPDLHMGPPPASMAKAGRMNAHGISGVLWRN